MKASEDGSLSWAVGVPALVDADGEVVPLTTETMYYGARMCRVLRISYSPSYNGWLVYTDIVTAPIEAFNLHRPDSFKKLEEDLNRVVTNNGEFSTSSCAYANRRIRDACDGCKLYNDSSEVICTHKMFEDIVSRIHKLAAKDGE